ncbi:MAG: replicative DNA helicase [Alphaproteobacteria bacterium]|nr:replicative DNA helicase [Alphaproteobacteria bacterium]
MKEDVISLNKERQLPHNYEVEQALLGALLVNNLVYEKIGEFLKPEHFSDPLHGRIYQAIGRLVESGQVADAITLKNQFDQDPTLKDQGGAKYLNQLRDSVISVINAESFAKQIQDLFIRRQLVDLGETIVNQAFSFSNPENGAHRQIESAEQNLYNLAETGHVEIKTHRFAVALSAAIKTAESAASRASHIAGVTSGLKDLDRKLGGLHPSDLIILAGRPSMGKTALAMNIAVNAAKAYSEKTAGKRGIDPKTAGAVTMFFSLEMSSEQLATRILAEKSGISSDRIRRGEIKSSDFTEILKASSDLEGLSLYIDDTPALSISSLRTRARRVKRQYGLGLIVIDYLQLMQSNSPGRIDNRVQEVSEITRGLKAIAKELHVPVLALSQLSRAVEMREDKRPQLADLRESGSIEQDADVVMFIYREQYYHEREQPKQRADEDETKFAVRYQRWNERGIKIHNIAEVNIAKQRHGPIGTIELFFDGALTRFDNLDPERKSQ